MIKIRIFLVVLFTCSLPAAAQFSLQKESVKKYEGFIPFYYDEQTDKIYFEITDLNKEFLYVYSLSSGIGSNDIGLDRGQLGNEQVVYFKKAGNKLLLIQPNLKFRALTDNELEKKSVEQAFAKSVLFGFNIKEEKNGKYIIDATDFLQQDVHGVARRLKQTKQGNYNLDKSKSAFNLERTKNFPKNTEIDVLLTFKGEPQGYYIRSVAPNPSLVTVTEHHSFIALPDDGYKKREFDPRCGSFYISYYDYASPVQEPILKRFITRHRLEKKNPEAAVSEPVEPIIYYLDNGTPEPVRSALLDGAKWWNEAFEAIGFKNAFQVKILPDNADPMDVRYNVIQWVHRSTRGWSYGGSIIDPRTGEILKGHVSLGSLRIRQDFMIAQALMNQPFKERDDNYEAMLNMALARIRQLSAHEIGHTLGFAHNFAASTNNRASVMDYPHPKLSLKNGEVDFSEAYDTGIGAWDKVTVAYSYQTFNENIDEKQALNAILEDAQQKGFRYITDADARAKGGAHAYAHLWDNGKEAVAELNNVLAIREAAITNFSEHNIRTNEPYTVLEDVFVPLYFFHRYQTEATVKLIAGMDYNYAVKGDNQLITSYLNKDVQQNALNQVLKTLSATTLAIPKDKLKLFPPRAMGYNRTRESFKSRTGVAFDALSAAETASDFTLSLLLHPERLSRLVQQKALDKNNLGLQEVLEQITNATIKTNYKDAYLHEINTTISFRVVKHLLKAAANSSSLPQVNAIVTAHLQSLKTWLINQKDDYALAMAKEIDAYLKKPESYKLQPSPKIPDGSPIGMDCY